MRGNATNAKDRIVTISLIPRAIVICFAFFQVLSKDWYYDGFPNNDGIPKTYAFSQSNWITPQQYSTASSRRESDSCDNWRKQTSSLTLLKRQSLAQLHNAITNTADINSGINSTESNANKASSSKRGTNTPVRNIMSILEERYDRTLLPDEVIDQTSKTREWKKTRNYLYHATRSQQDQSGGEVGDDVDGVGVTAFEQQVVSVIDFLDEHLDLPPNVSKRILQDSPRILRKPVDSFLIPTADFLLQLWGRDLFVQAVERNPALLLSSGVGYTTNRKRRAGRSSSSSSSRTTDSATTDANGTMVGGDTSSGSSSSSSSSIDHQNVEEILFAHAGLSSSAMDRIKGTAPFVFGLEASKVRSVLEFLQGILKQREEDNTTDEATTTEEDELKRKKILGKMILAYPYLLNLPVESNLKPRVQFLAESCDLNPTQVAKVVQTSNGSVLSLSVEQNLKPTMDFLLEEIFHDSDNGNDNDHNGDRHGDDPKTMLKKCVLTHPQLLGLSLTNLKSKVNYFHSIGPSLAVRIARKCPAIYSLNLDQNIIPTIEFLSRVWGMKSETNASKKKKSKSNNDNNNFVPMLHEYPNIITLSVETNLQPTMMFFNKTGYTLLNENWELISITSTPTKTGSSRPKKPDIVNDKQIAPIRIRGRYIAASLYNRLLPRWHYCRSGYAEDKISEDSAVSTFPPVTPPLHLLVMASDYGFCQAMDFELESFLSFKKEAIPRLKFSSQFDTWLKTGKPIDL